MNPSQLLKLANNFERLASIKGNMAKRIFFSLLGSLVPANETARVQLTGGMIDYTALKQMIAGAKELLEYGTKACVQESDFSYNIDSKDLDSEPKSAYADALALYEQCKVTGDYSSCLLWLTKVFAKDPPGTGFGGPTWFKIADVLYQINNDLLDARSAKKAGDSEAEIDSLKSMIVSMNLLDALVHNSGSIMDKIQDLEQLQGFQTDSLIDHNKVYKRRKEIERLMDVKELVNPEEVLQQILPILEKETDAPLTMKDWMHRARQKRHIDVGGRTEEKLAKIRKKKSLITQFHSRQLPHWEKRLNTLLLLPDNIAAKEVVKNTGFVDSLSSICKLLLNESKDLISEDVINKLSEYYTYFSKYDMAAINRLIDENQHYALRKFMEFCADTIKAIYSIIENIQTE